MSRHGPREPRVVDAADGVVVLPGPDAAPAPGGPDRVASSHPAASMLDSSCWRRHSRA